MPCSGARTGTLSSVWPVVLCKAEPTDNCSYCRTDGICHRVLAAYPFVALRCRRRRRRSVVLFFFLRCIACDQEIQCERDKTRQYRVRTDQVTRIQVRAVPQRLNRLEPFARLSSDSDGDLVRFGRVKVPVGGGRGRGREEARAPRHVHMPVITQSM